MWKDLDFVAQTGTGAPGLRVPPFWSSEIEGLEGSWRVSVCRLRDSQVRGEPATKRPRANSD
jgi:hypothetical protein